MKNYTSLMTVLAVCLATVLVHVTSRADLIVYEGFDYDTGSISGQDGGSGWTSASSISAAGGTAEVTSPGS